MPADRCLSGATRTFFSVAALRRLCVRWTTSVVVDPFRRPATPTGQPLSNLRRQGDLRLRE